MGHLNDFASVGFFAFVETTCSQPPCQPAAAAAAATSETTRGGANTERTTPASPTRLAGLPTPTHARDQVTPPGRRDGQAATRW